MDTLLIALSPLDAPWCSCTSTHASKGLLDSLPADLRDLYLPAATKPEKFQAGKPVEGSSWELAVSVLSVVGLVWYGALWFLSVLGCMSA